MTRSDQAQDFLERASNKQKEAKRQLEQYNYAESISASQECIELSIKAGYLILGAEFSKTHELKETEFMKIIQKIPEHLEFCNFPRLYLLSKFWSDFYLVAKYGLEHLRVGPKRLFKDKEANLALEHAGECYQANNALLQSKISE